MATVSMSLEEERGWRASNLGPGQRSHLRAAETNTPHTGLRPSASSARGGVPAAFLTRKCDDLLLFPGWTKGWRQARSSALHAVTSRPLTTHAKQAAREPATLCIRSPSATGSCGRIIALCGSVALQTQNFAHLCSVQLPGALAQTGRSLPRRLLHHEDDPEEALEAAFR